MKLKVVVDEKLKVLTLVRIHPEEFLVPKIWFCGFLKLRTHFRPIWWNQTNIYLRCWVANLQLFFGNKRGAKISKKYSSFGSARIHCLFPPSLITSFKQILSASFFAYLPSTGSSWLSNVFVASRHHPWWASSMMNTIHDGHRPWSIFRRFNFQSSLTVSVVIKFLITIIVHFQQLKLTQRPVLQVGPQASAAPPTC